MWFAINVKPGKEQQALALIQDTAQPAGIQELFVPQAAFQVRRGSEWVETTMPLFPGKLMAVAPSRKEVRTAIRRARGIDELMPDAPSAEELSDDETSFIDGLTQPGNRTVAVSEGYVDEGRVVVVSGPLCGREDLISRVSHRKRSARLSAGVAGSAAPEVGLRVTRRQEAAAAAAV